MEDEGEGKFMECEPRVDRRRSCSLASATAWGNDRGFIAWTFRRSSGVRPDMKQLRRKRGARSTVRLAWRLKSVK